MADNFRVLDLAVDELQANLNAQTEPWVILQWNFYWQGSERRVTMVMVKAQQTMEILPPAFDPRRLRQK